MRRTIHLILALAVAFPAAAAVTSGDTVGAEPKKAAKPAEPDCSEPLRGADGKLTARYDPRCTEEMIEAAQARMKAESPGAKPAAGAYDLGKIEGLEGLGKPSVAEASGEGKKEYGTFEDLFGIEGLFSASQAYASEDVPKG